MSEVISIMAVVISIGSLWFSFHQFKRSSLIESHIHTTELYRLTADLKKRIYRLQVEAQDVDPKFTDSEEFKRIYSTLNGEIFEILKKGSVDSMEIQRLFRALIDTEISLSQSEIDLELARNLKAQVSEIKGSR